MRYFILILMAILPFASRTQTLSPEHTWHDNNSDKGKWYTKQMGSTVGSFNGNMFAFNYRDDGNYNGAHTYMFRVNQKFDYAPMTPYKLGPSRSYKLIFGYENESNSFDPGSILGKTFCFQFDQRLWYFQQVKNAAGEHETNKNESYECWAQMPLDTMLDPFTFYWRTGPPPELTKMGAFQYDSNLYFISRNTNSSSSNYNKWAIEEYRYSSSSNKFYGDRPKTYIPQLLNSKLGGILRRLDENGNEYFLVNTYVTDGGCGIYKLKPNNSSGHTVFDISEVATGQVGTTAATTIVEGAIKGNKTSDAHPQYSDRVTLYSINYNTSSDGTHHISYNEFYIVDTLSTSYGALVNHGEITIPTSTAPNKGSGSDYQLVGTYQLKPTHFTNAFDTDSTSTYDGFMQYVWLFYPDKNQNFNGINLLSDNWRLNSEPIVQSIDLVDTISYPGIKSLWSLIGISDNGPPCSVDWEKWYDPANQYHDKGVDPTELEFTVTAGRESEVKNTYEDQWSVGEDMDFQKHILKLETSLSEEFKYSSTYKNTVAKTSEVKTTYTQTFGLSDETQELAVLLWAVPDITRYPFSTFAWWDNTLKYPIPNSNQYLFRMTNIAIWPQYVPIESYPFKIHNPNDSTMSSWSALSRDSLSSYSTIYGSKPIVSPTWTAPGNGQTKTYSIENGSMDSYEQTTEYEVNVSAGVEVPKVFSVGLTTGYKVSYSTENTITDKFGTEITCNLTNLNSIYAGPKISRLGINTYWFRNNTGVDWWYYKYFGDQRPWYIAYVVSTATAGLKLQAPANNTVTGVKDLLFDWEDEFENLTDYELVISKSSPIDNTGIIYRQQTGDSRVALPATFKPEAGKTYYWSVSGKTDDGTLVHSDTYSFTIEKEKDTKTGSGLKAMVYPNPGSGKDVQIIAARNGGGNVRFVISDLNGTILADREMESVAGVPVTFSCAELNLAPGVYLAMISDAQEKVVRKIIIR